MRDLQTIARRAWRRTVPIAISGLVVGVLVGVFLSDGEDPLTRFLIILGFGLALGGLGGAGSLLPATFRLAPSMLAPVRDLGRRDRRKLRREVFAGRPIWSRESDIELRAVGFARGAVVSLPIALAQSLFTFATIGGVQLPNLVSDDGWLAGFARVFIAAILLVSVGFSLSMSRQIRGVRRYLSATGGR